MLENLLSDSFSVFSINFVIDCDLHHINHAADVHVMVVTPRVDNGAEKACKTFK